MDNKLHPYYIIAPRYTRTSAGVKVLYRLADLLNKNGCSAFLFMRPDYNRDLGASPSDIAPFLSKKVVDHHFAQGLAPIVIYPEVYDASQLNSPVSVRYVLNYNGLLGELRDPNLDDYTLCYSEKILDDIGPIPKASKLFIPVSDHIFFHPPKEGSVRSGGVFYATKYKQHFKGNTFDITNDMLEITKDKFGSQTPEEIRRLFQSAEYFYCYEDSALALEAILCGCPTVFLPNEYFKGPLGAVELGGLGYAIGNSEEQLKHATNTVKAARDHYLSLYKQAEDQINIFVSRTQVIARSKSYELIFADGIIRGPNFLEIIIGYQKMLQSLVMDRGLIYVCSLIIRRLIQGRFKVH